MWIAYPACPSSMPRFLVYAPDYPNVLEKRMSVRPEHKKRAQLDQGINGE